MYIDIYTYAYIYIKYKYKYTYVPPSLGRARLTPAIVAFDAAERVFRVEGKHQCPARQQLRRRHVHLNTPVRVSSPKTHTTSSQQSGHAHPIASAVRKHTPFRVSISETHTSSSQQTAHPGGRELSAFRKPAAPQSQCPPQQTAVRVST